MVKNNLVIITVLIHAFLWIAFILLPIIFYNEFRPQREFGPNRENPIDLMALFISNLLLIGLFYANYKYFLPNFFFNKKYVLYFFSIFLIIILIIFITFFFLYLGKPPRADVPIIPMPFIINFLLRFSIVFMLSMGVSFYEKWQKIEKEKNKAEISYLKAQINPHFLFNTLNSIYALAVKKSEDTPVAIVKLSNIMRYVTTDSETDFVSIEKELNYIRSYIDLQKLRLTNKVKLECYIEENSFDKKIAPLILIPYIENAFKYGISTDEESYIKIEIYIKSTELNFIVRNKIVKNINNSFDQNSGLGLVNSAKRLQLIYPSKHELTIKSTNDAFYVNLKITDI